MTEDSLPPVVRNEEEERFQMELDGQAAVLTYSLEGGRIHLLHTETPEAFRGRGIGSRLVKAALEHARAEDLSVVPICPFVKTYIRRHPEYQPLVHEG